MELTEKESEIIHNLLVQQGITIYKVLPTAPEGMLLHSPFPEVRSMSGYIITPTKVYDFWLDWSDGHYTLGQGTQYWEELSIDPNSQNRDERMILATQKQLGQKGEIPKK